MFIASIRELDERLRVLAHSTLCTADMLRKLPAMSLHADGLVQLVRLAEQQAAWLRSAGTTPSPPARKSTRGDA